MKMYGLSLPRSLGWGASLLWCIATMFGWAVYWSPLTGASNSMLSTFSITSGIWDMTYPFLSALGGITTGAIGGGIIGLGQRRVLQSWGHPVTGWTLATIVGMTLGWTISQPVLYAVLAQLRIAHGWELTDVLGQSETLAVTSQSALLVGAIVGLAVGIAQWLVLRSKTKKAIWWIAVCVAAWSLGASIYWVIYGVIGGRLCQTWGCLDQALEPDYYRALVIGWSIGGAVVAVITLSAMRLLLAQHRAYSS